MELLYEFENHGMSDLASKGNQRLQKGTAITQSAFRLGNQSMLEAIKEDTGMKEVVQFRLLSTYDAFIATQRNITSESDGVQRYLERHVMPEVPVLRRIFKFWSLDDTNREKVSLSKRAGHLLKRAEAISVGGSLGRNIRKTCEEIIVFENDAQTAFPIEYRQIEKELIYPSSDISSDDAAAQTREIFAGMPQRIGLTDGQLTGDDYQQAPAVIRFKDFQERFHEMQGLLNLMNHIHMSWVQGQIFDRRTDEQVEHMVSTTDEPGGIRCIHKDENPGNRVAGNLNYQIPPPPKRGARQAQAAAPALPAQGPQAYHDYVTDHAIYGDTNNLTPKKKDKSIRETGKFLVEYSGIPFGGERRPHNNKIVFNYLNGDMYVTLNHYHVMIQVDMSQ